MIGELRILDGNRGRSKEALNENQIIHSRVRSITGRLDDSRYCICVGIDGMEEYDFTDRKVFLEKDQYFIRNVGDEGEVDVSKKEAIEGMCFRLSPIMIREVFDQLQISIEDQLDGVRSSNNDFPHFNNRIFHLKENRLGKILSDFRHILLSEGKILPENRELFYYQLIEGLFRHHMEVEGRMKRLPHIKRATQEEVFHRLSIARMYILENFQCPISVDEVAKEAMFSKFHVVRMYKALFGITPYQHILQLRLDKAKDLLLEDRSPTDIAYQLSFSDRRAFAKAFKKVYHLTPHQFQRGEPK